MVGIVIKWSDSNIRQACIGAIICGLCILFLVGSVSITRSLILTAAAWLSVFSFFSLVSTVISLSVTQKPSVNYTYGFARAPVLAVFATTVSVYFPCLLDLNIFSNIAKDYKYSCFSVNSNFINYIYKTFFCKKELCEGIRFILVINFCK